MGAIYSLNTWLPELMRRAGFDAKGSLAFLLVLNGGAVIGALIGSRVADRFGPKPVVAGCFLIGALSIAVLTVSLPLGLLLAFVAIVGLGTSGTPDTHLRLRGQLLPDQCARCGGGGLVCRVRSVGRCRGPDAGGISHRRPAPSTRFLCAGRIGRARYGSDRPRAGRARPPRGDDDPGGADAGEADGGVGIAAGRNPEVEATMYDRMLVAVDTTPDENNPALQQTGACPDLRGI
jgi:hypothetical protein